MHALAGLVAVLALVAPAAPIVGLANVVAGGGYSASYSGQSAYTNVAPGDSGQASAIFFNDGTQTWLPGVVGLLVCASDKVTCGVSANGGFAKSWYTASVYASTTTVVVPGQNGYFTFNFAVPIATSPGTATAFYGDLGIISTGAVLRPQGYFHVNTTPFITTTLSPSDASVAVGAFQQFAVASAPVGSVVTWSVAGGCGAVTTTGLFAATAMNSLSQPCSVLAKVGTVTLRAPVTVYGAPTQMSCDIAPTSLAADGGSATAGTAIARITLRDANGNVAANATSPQISVVNVTPLLAQMSPLGLVTPSAGVVAVTMTTTAVPGSIQVSASTPGFAGCNAIATSVGAGTPAKTVATVAPATIAADGISTTELSVDVTDANGIRVATDNLTQITVAQTSVSGICNISSYSRGFDASISGASASVRVSQGRITLLVRSTTTPGQCQYAIFANNSSIAGTTAALTTRAVGAAARVVLLSTDSPHQAALVGTCGLLPPNTDPSCTTITVGVQDAQGALLTGDAGRTIYANIDPGSCNGGGGGDVVLRGSTSTTAGKATFVFSSAGSYRACSITFSTLNLTSVSVTATWTAGTADHLACAVTPTALPAGLTTVARVDVTVRDARGNVASDGTYPVTLNRVNGGSTTIQGAAFQYTSLGVASFTIVSYGLAGIDTYLPSLTAGSLRVGSTSCSVSVQ